MPDLDLSRLARLLELAAHPTSNEGEALNALRAARAMLQKSGRSLHDLKLDTPSVAPPTQAGAELERLRAQARTITAERDRLRSENARLRRETAALEGLRAELDLLREAQAASGFSYNDEAEDRPAPITPNVVAVFDLLAEWRSIPDLVEKLDSGLGQAGVKRIVRLLHDKGLLRSVESWPTRYRLRFEGELSDAARSFRSRIEDARVAS